MSSRRASLLSRRSCLSISWLMRFCSLASSDRQHAIAAATVAALCGPVHHDDGGRRAAVARPLLPAVLSTRRSHNNNHHHHHHQRGQQQQIPRATPQWPQRRASLKTHCVLCRPRPRSPPPLLWSPVALRRRRQPAARHRPHYTPLVVLLELELVLELLLLLLLLLERGSILILDRRYRIFI